jgi:hypothetical protein
MSDQALGALVDAIGVLHTSIRTKLMQAGLEDSPQEQQKLFDVICRALKRLALDPTGINMVMHPLISSEMYERMAVILSAVERDFAHELQQLQDLVAPYRFRDVPLTLFSDPDVLRAAKEGLAARGHRRRAPRRR